MEARLKAKANQADEEKVRKLLASLRLCENALWNTTESLISLANADSSYGDHLTMVYNLDECKRMLRQTAHFIKAELAKVQIEPFGPKYAAASEELEVERAAKCKHKDWRMRQNPAKGGKPTPYCEACQRHCVP